MERLNLIVLKMETYLGVVLIGSMLGLIFINILMRYLLTAPIYWSDELASYLFVYSTLLSAASAIQHDSHVRVGVIFNKLPLRVQKLFLILQYLLIFGVSLVLFMATFKIFRTLGPSPAMQIHEKYIYLILPVTFVLFFLHSMFQIVNRVAHLFRKQKGA